jgi:hypothetical protein
MVELTLISCISSAGRMSLFSLSAWKIKRGINFRVVQKNGCLKQQIIDYTNNKKEILFAVTESFENLDLDCSGKGKKLSEAWQKLRCPLVVVAENA